MPIFAEFFGENILKNYNIGPGFVNTDSEKQSTCGNGEVSMTIRFGSFFEMSAISLSGNVSPSNRMGSSSRADEDLGPT
jgi:hypothetical protein